MTTHIFRKTLLATILGAQLLSGTAVLADTTLVLDLQEKLNQQSATYAERIETLRKLEGNRQAGDVWYEKARSLPENSVDQKYAVAKYVNEQARIMEPMLRTVQELRGINGDLERTVERLSEALAREQEERADQNLNHLSPEVYEKTMENLSGAHTLMAVMSQDPEISQRPEFAMVSRVHEEVIGQLQDATENPQTDLAGLLQKMVEVIEAQGVLMDIAEDRMRQDARRLQVLSTWDTSAVVTARIQKVMDKLSGLFDGSYGQTARRQTRDLLRRTRPSAMSSGASRDGMAETGAWLKKMRVREPVDQ